MVLTLSRPGLREVTVLFGLLAVGLFAASVTVLVMVRRSRRTLPPETESEEEARLERRLRETFGFTGSPVRISVRVRERRSR